MPIHYGPPFKMFDVKDPSTEKRLRLASKEKAFRLAEELARKHGKKREDILSESRTFFVKEYGGKWSRRVNTSQETKFLAREWCNRRIRELRGPTRHSRMDFETAASDWLEGLDDGHRTPKTIGDYRSQARFWLEQFKGMTLNEITREDLERFFKARRNMRGKTPGYKKVGARILNLNLILLRCFFKWCRRKGIVDTNPTEGVKSWKTLKRVPRVLEVDEIQKLLQASRTPYGITVRREGFRPYEEERFIEPPKYVEAAMVCALTSCLRLGNVLGLRWGDVDMERGLISVPAERTKTRVEMLLPLSRSFKQVLLSLPKGGETEPIFPAKEFKRSFNSAVRRAGLKGVTFHCLRKTGATHCLRAKIPTEVVRALGGWSSSGDVLLTDYRYVDASELREAVDVLDRLVAGTPVKKATSLNA